MISLYNSDIITMELQEQSTQSGRSGYGLTTFFPYSVLRDIYRSYACNMHCTRICVQCTASCVLTVASVTQFQAFSASANITYFVGGEHQKVGKGLVFAPVSGILGSSVGSTHTKGSIQLLCTMQLFIGFFHSKMPQNAQNSPHNASNLKFSGGADPPPRVVAFGLTTEKQLPLPLHIHLSFDPFESGHRETGDSKLAPLHILQIPGSQSYEVILT